MPRPRTFRVPHRMKFGPEEIIDIAVDGALPISEDAVYRITKGSAAAISIAAPGAVNVGRYITVHGGSDFAHVLTFTGATLRDGTTGGHATATSPAFAGGALTFQAVSATLWSVVANNLFVITT